MIDINRHWYYLWALDTFVTSFCEFVICKLISGRFWSSAINPGYSLQCTQTANVLCTCIYEWMNTRIYTHSHICTYSISAWVWMKLARRRWQRRLLPFGNFTQALTKSSSWVKGSPLCLNLLNCIKNLFVCVVLSSSTVFSAL